MKHEGVYLLTIIMLLYLLWRQQRGEIERLREDATLAYKLGERMQAVNATPLSEDVTLDDYLEGGGHG